MGEYTFAAGKAAQALRELGFTTPQQLAALRDLPLKEQLMAIAEAMRRVPSEADQVRISLDLFGRSGAGMVVMLKEGAAGIQQLYERAGQLGVRLDEAMVQRGAAAAGALRDLKDIWHGFTLTLTDLAAPAITELIKGLNAKLLATRQAAGGTEGLTQKFREFAEAWSEPTLNALKMGVIGARIAGLQGAALGATAGFMGLTSTLRELAEILQNPAMMALMGGAAGSRLGVWGAAAGGVSGLMGGFYLSGQARAKEAERLAAKEFAGYETPMAEQLKSPLLDELRWAESQRRIQDLLGPGVRAKPGAGRGAAGPAAEDLWRREVDATVRAYQEIFNAASTTVAQVENLWAGYVRTREEQIRLEKEDLEDLGVSQELAGRLATARRTEMGEFLEKLKEQKTEGAAAFDMTKYLGQAKDYYATLAGLTPNLQEQLALKERLLPLEQELSRLSLEKLVKESEMPEHLRAELQGLQALVFQAQQFDLQRQAWGRGGVAGGLRLGAYEMTRTGETWYATQIADWMKAAPREISTSMASWFVDSLRGRKTDLESLFWNIPQMILQKFIEGWLNQVIPVVGNSLANLFNSLMGGGGGGFFSWIFGGGGGGGGGGVSATPSGYFGEVNPWAWNTWHEGGLIRAHRGLRLAPDEVPLIAQTGERILSRSQNDVFEAGLLAPRVNVIVNNQAEGTKATAEQLPNGDVAVTIVNLVTQDYLRKGPLWKAVNQSTRLTR
jgi:uncharacterized protein YjiS (DUF1127 family)